jgi:predicted transcriptional regulator
MLKTYLEELIIKGLVLEKRLGTGKTYFLTEKGLKYIQEYQVILGFVDSFGLNE